MKSIYILLIGLLATFGTFAQEYKSSIAINHADSFDITAMALYDNGDMVTASLIKRVYPPGGSGFPDMMNVGKLVLRKLDGNGMELWKKDFNHSAARITKILITHNDDIIISGGFHDSLRFLSHEVRYAAPSRLNAFIASYSSNGNLNWVHATGSDPYFHRYYYTFAIHNNLIYAPFVAHANINFGLHVLNLQGDSVNDIKLSDDGFLVSEMEFDANGNLLLCGTADSRAKLTGSPIGNDSTLGYTTFIAKLNSNLQHDWSYTYEYVTADFYPQMALGQNEIGFIVDTMPVPHLGTGNYHQLVFYSYDGQHLGRDSIGGGIFTPQHRNIALEYFDGDYVYVGIKGWDTLSVMKVDPQFNYTQIGEIDLENFGSKPQFAKSNNVLALSVAFMDSAAVVNDTDWVINPKHTYPYYTSYQQMVIRFDPSSSTTIAEDKQDFLDFTLYPNPSSDGLLKMDFTNPIKEDIVLTIYSLTGSRITAYSIEPNAISFEAYIPKLQKGIYIIELKGSTTHHTTKWVRN